MKTACNTDKSMSSNQPHSDDAQNPRKPNHDAQGLLRRQMQQAVLLYGSGESHPSLQKIADELALNPIKVRKLLITAGVYRSEIATRVNERFSAYQQEGVPHKGRYYLHCAGYAAFHIRGGLVPTLQQMPVLPCRDLCRQPKHRCRTPAPLYSCAALARKSLRENSLELHCCFSQLPIYNAFRLAIHLRSKNGTPRQIY